MKKALLIVLCFVGLIANSQNIFRLNGRILDENGQPLPGATIYISSLNIGTATDHNGFYEFLDISESTLPLRISFIGYETLETSVSLDKNTQLSNFSLVPKTNRLSEVIIKGSIGKGQAKALNQQKNKDNITNIVSADQVGKFPDANIGDALKRIPGIAMQNDQGEARDIIIRGLAPQLNSVTLNGDRIPSAEGNNRRVQMDLIPSDMIHTIEVNKAVTPDLEGDAIGGSVNLITRSAPNSFRAYASASYGRNPIRNSPIYNFSALVADRIFSKKLGYVVNASLNSNDYGSDNVEFEWKKDEGKTFISEHDIRRYDVKRVRKSMVANFDYIIDKNHTIFLKSMYNQRNDYENRYRLRFRKIKKPNSDGIAKAEVRRQTKGGINNSTNDNSRLERQTTYMLSVGGEHLIFEKVKINWKTGASKAKEHRPNERYIRFKSKNITVKQNFSDNNYPKLIPTNGNYNNPSKFKFDESSEEKKYTEEYKLNSKIDVNIPLNSNEKYKNSLKFGLKNKYKEKLRDNNYFEYDLESISPTMDKSTVAGYGIKSYLAGYQYHSGIFTSKEYLGNLKLNNGKSILEEFVPKNYNAEENIFASYAMIKQQLGHKLQVIAGLRTETSSVIYEGYKIDVETAKSIKDVKRTKGNKTYINFLPNLQAKIELNKSTILRTSWTNTIARPNYYDLVPYVNINSDDQEASYGNPNLNATESMNFDIMFEKYLSTIGILSAGVFYKDIDKFIYNANKKEKITVGTNTELYDVTRPLNGGTASIYGIEVSIQRRLDFLPSFLSNLTLFANYTYTDSKTKGIEGREDGLPLAGAVRNMFNGSIAFETNKVSIRTSLNYTDDYISEYGKNTFNDIYYDKQMFLDINATYQITKKIGIIADFKNLTNQELRFYQGYKHQTRQAEFYNFNWNLGIKYNF